MADSQDKYSSPRAQGSHRRAHASTKAASTKPERSIQKQQHSPRKHRSPQKPRKRAKRKQPERIPSLFRFKETRRGKTTIRRYSNRAFHQMKEFQGKVVDYVQVFTSGGYNSISVRFQDKTSLDFAIDTCFTLDTDYTDWKTGNMRLIKRWPLIHSESRHV